MSSIKTTKRSCIYSFFTTEFYVDGVGSQEQEQEKNNKNKLVLYPGFVDMRMVDIWNTKDPQILARTKMLIIYCFHTMWQFKLGVR